MPELHPSIFVSVAAAIVPWSGRHAGRALAVVAPLVALVALLALPDGTEHRLLLLGHEWQLLRVDALGRVFACAFLGFAAIAGLFASADRAGVRAGGLLLAGAGVGVVLAGDFLSLFVFWEWLAIASTWLVWTGKSRRARAAGVRYFYLHAAGGASLLCGLVGLSAGGGGLDLAPLGLDDIWEWLVLIGFLLNAAVPPLHAWLPDAYPEATPAGTVYLSAFTTKAAVCVLARVFAGHEVLVWTGVAMALYGVVFAVLENDVRRLLAYHIVSQVGYMVAGIGLGTALALDGVAAHAFSHIFYKGLLLMSVGAVVHATGRGKLTELGGLARVLPLALVFNLIGAFSISGVPLFSGFASKSMIVDAAAYGGRGAVEILLLVASMGTFLHTGLKLPYFTFAGNVRTAPLQRRVPVSMWIAMGLAGSVCVATGVVPSLLYRMLPAAGAGYEPFTAAHVATALELLAATALAFWLLRAKLGGEPTVTLDADRLYRAPLGKLIAALPAVLGVWHRARDELATTAGAAGTAIETGLRSRRTRLGLAGLVAALIASILALVIAGTVAAGG